MLNIEPYKLRYVLCELNDENYTSPSFSFHKGYDSAQYKAIDSIIESFKADEGFNLRIETTEPQYEYDKGRKVIRIDGNYESYEISEPTPRFYVTEIFEIDITKGDCLLIYHHAYDGIDFHIEYQGTYKECLEERKRQVIQLDKELCSLSDGVDENFDPETDNCLDDGNEWHYWSIVKIQLD